MPQPIVCLDEEVRHFAERFRPQLWIAELQ
jgi:hypothetical protein